jgi:hypothetical protein
MIVFLIGIVETGLMILITLIEVMVEVVVVEGAAVAMIVMTITAVLRPLIEITVAVDAVAVIEIRLALLLKIVAEIGMIRDDIVRDHDPGLVLPTAENEIEIRIVPLLVGPINPIQ